MRGTAKVVKLQVRVTAEIATRIRAEAKVSGMTVSEYIRMCVKSVWL